jgi:hypothetical protein
MAFTTFTISIVFQLGDCKSRRGCRHACCEIDVTPQMEMPAAVTDTSSVYPANNLIWARIWMEWSKRDFLHVEGHYSSSSINHALSAVDKGTL